MLDLFTAPERSAEAILSRTVRVVLNDTEYVLPVLRIAGNRRWKAELDAATIGLVEGLEAGGNDIAAILGIFGSQTDLLLDLLLSYDVDHVLPSREVIEETAYDVELVQAVREVWRAANPLAVTGVEMVATPTPDSSPPTNTSPRPTAGRRKRSNSH